MNKLSTVSLAQRRGAVTTTTTTTTTTETVMMVSLLLLIMTACNPSTMKVTAFVPKPNRVKESVCHDMIPTSSSPFGRRIINREVVDILSEPHKKKPSSTTQLSVMINPSTIQVSTTAAVAAASTLPALLGYYKSEWGVSYGYGIGVAASAAIVLLRSSSAGSSSTLLTYHAAALVAYGVRLSLFLAIRTRLSARQREFQQSVEDRAKARGSRLSRTPFLISCGLLYYGLVSPVLLMSKAATVDGIVSSTFKIIWKLLIGITYTGFGIAALGDWTKTWVKQVTEKDETFLVTSGIFKYLRHPNYTGEIIGWSSNAVVGVMASVLLLLDRSSGVSIPFLVGHGMLTLIGALGINFVLLRATQNLEKRQKEMYGDSDKYKEWAKSSWSGWSFPDASTKSSEKSSGGDDDDVPHLELNSDAEEDFGSGI